MLLRPEPVSGQCPAVPLLGLFSQALAQNGTMSWWKSITFPAVNFMPRVTTGNTVALCVIMANAPGNIESRS
jgi:hypothetical protein